MSASTDAPADRDVAREGLQRDLVGCGMPPADAAAQAERELTIAAVRAWLAQWREEFQRALPLARHEIPAHARRAQVVRVRLGVAGLAAVAAVPAAVLADGAAAVLGWVLMVLFVVAGGSFVLLLTRTDHLDVDDDLPDRARVYADHIDLLVHAQATLEACRPSLLAPLDRVVTDLGREIAARSAEAAALDVG
ncbi:hypothetical protein [Kineosporia sp. A_224]|uniref:hypothetical protein n=1 Tax=Kineosporia sp. A_224 TaxID=1962180 RepID=UPI000B4AFD32|nr:hypothetical protein [Kineosporia sp. A_224]